MAVYKLGALVTGIVGSIGGTTFKRQGSGLVMMRKSNGASRSSLLQNPRLNRNATIFKKWSYLPDATKLAWEVLASTNKVKDKFGNDVNISGVNFQRRCDLAVNFMNEYPDPFDWSSTLAGFKFDFEPVINWTNSTFDIKFSILEPSATFALMVEYSLNPLNAPVFIRRGVWFFGNFDTNVSQDLFDEFFSAFPFLNSSYNLRLYAYNYNSSGVVSGLQSSLVIAV
jgi:hypothetical protein